MLTYQNFKDGPAAAICQKARFNITGFANWNEYTRGFHSLNNKIDHDLPKRFQSLPASSGEMAVIQAILHAADCSLDADEIERTWSRLSYVTGEHAEAVAAAILRRA